MGQVTIRDVAREAAVSVATVSRALNGLDNVRPDLVRHVREVAARLGYVPHAGARHLSMARSGVIGVVLPDLHGEFFSELLRGIDRAVSDRGLHLLLMVMHGEAERGIAALHAMRGRVDGLIVMAPQVAADELLAHLPVGSPVVLMNCAPHQARHAELRLDNVAGAAAMIEHLVAQGRRHLVHIAGPQSNVDAQERLIGACQASERAGVALQVVPGDFQEASGTAAVATLLASRARMDAIFAGNDMMAIGAMTALKRAGVDVPEDVAIAGFDDIPVARMITPSLTTASFDIAGLGARAVARLAAVMAGTDDLTIERRTPIVVARESTGTPHPFNTENPAFRDNREVI